MKELERMVHAQTETHMNNSSTPWGAPLLPPQLCLLTSSTAPRPGGGVLC